MLDTHFGFNITDVIALEGFPFIRCMKRAISCSATIGFCCSSRLAEIFDEVFSLCEFLFLKT
jgi:hypothetical protein